MIGKRKPQTTLFDVGALKAIQLPPASFYAQLAAAAPTLYPDADFAALYRPGGRPSVPPSQLALLVVMQFHANVSDAEAMERSAFDARWAVVLGTELGAPLCAKSTLQLFRAKLVLHQQTRLLLRGSLQEARRRGQLPEGPLEVAVDTLCTVGAGAVKDTWNLLATGIWQVIQAAARELHETPAAWAARHELMAYVPDPHSSVKGALDLDWSDAQAREEALAVIVAAAVRAWQLAEALAASLAAAPAERLRQAQLLLGELILQDVEIRHPEGGPPQVGIKPGTEPDRIPSGTDEEQRHGHKSKANRFTGHKTRPVVTLSETPLFLDVEILAGNASDAAGVCEQIERVCAEPDVEIGGVWGDCAFGNGSTRAAFVEQGITLNAKVPAEAERATFPKSRFTLELTVGSATCPAGITTTDWRATPEGGRIYFFGLACDDCPLRAQCTTSARGRTIQQHPQEALLRAARAAAATPEGRATLRRRTVVEHRQAQLARLGMKQARYFGRAKTLFQAMATATVVNLRLIWNRAGEEPAHPGGPTVPTPMLPSPTNPTGNTRTGLQYLPLRALKGL